MAQFTLYSHLGPGPNPLKVAILLEKLGLSYDVVPLVFGDDPEKGVKGKFLKINPNGRVPALVDHQNKDFTVWESGAILLYLVGKYDKEGKFLGKTVEEQTITHQVSSDGAKEERTYRHADVKICFAAHFSDPQWLLHQMSGLGPVQGVSNWMADTSFFALFELLIDHALMKKFFLQNLNYALHYWLSTYGEEASKSVFTRFEGETHRLYKLLDEQLEQQAARGSQWIALVSGRDLARVTERPPY